ncbi:MULTISPECIES: hypothetical protein [Alkalihalophilus]|jgi:hypothetical protein|uniref:Uncharacterized protein n=3 Tax=Alkalihalophilus TaxID=2893060 RepID=D3FVF4_ALKPO|nr:MULTISPECIES: hypothetical protein [Alkalihalophilus]ADC48469.1 hypothetical protein BpOF4_02010 [Alkalihalophilus pseudofirmus OF4]ERN52917.1 hypothetical protein A33I_14635 [Alkalihalophilus marmarensis DSM 21297]MCM3489169.1 hypothetical protein [Alkalihalophilus marmarensis]MDV2885649.1 hypothetical protein [Alkalihalophilus pseudofirmus]MEC2074346.1 hypothetical protein [Alkalihalophilus marmarensis]
MSDQEEAKRLILLFVVVLLFGSFALGIGTVDSDTASPTEDVILLG